MYTLPRLLAPSFFSRLVKQYALRVIYCLCFLQGVAQISTAATINASNEAELVAALAAAKPGDTISLMGTITLKAKLSTSKSGTAAAPISIIGAKQAILLSDAPHGLLIAHDFYRLSNFRIEKSAGKGLIIDNAKHGVVENVHCSNTVQEGFKIRNQSEDWLFIRCSARRTGTGGKFGEGFSIGQAASRWIDGKVDACAHITFFNCYSRDTANEGWDIKEGSHHIKIVNCTADFSGDVEPAADSPNGNAGFFVRADDVQMIKCRVTSLDNHESAWRIANQTVNGIEYGSKGAELKGCAVSGGDVTLVFGEKGTKPRVYSDCIAGPGGLNGGTQYIEEPEAEKFTELTWNSPSGEPFGQRQSGSGALADPLTESPSGPK